MNYKTVTLTFKTYRQFKDYPYIQVTKCKKVINTKKGCLINYGVRGFYIEGKYYKRSELNKMLEPIRHTNLDRLLSDLKSVI